VESQKLSTSGFYILQTVTLLSFSLLCQPYASKPSDFTLLFLRPAHAGNMVFQLIDRFMPTAMPKKKYTLADIFLHRGSDAPT
jgi:hypothetical protein